MTRSAHGHLYASVPRDPARWAARYLGQEATSAPADLVRRATEKAQQQGGLDLVQAYWAQSDLHLQNGRLSQAKNRLLQASVASYHRKLPRADAATARREAWIDYLSARLSAVDTLVHLHAEAEAAGDAYEASVLGVYLALVFARQDQHQRVPELIRKSLATLRQHQHHEALIRMALLASMAYADAGLMDAAQVEVLRVRTYARQLQNGDLLAAAESVLKRVQTHYASDQRVHHLVSVAIDVGRRRSVRQVFESVVSSALEILDADRAFVVRRVRGGAAVEAAATKNGDDPGRPSASIVRRALVEGREVISSDLDRDGTLNAAQSIVSLGLRTALCVPMMDGPEVIGAIYADSTRHSSQELHEAAWLLRAFAAHAVSAVRNAEQLEQADRRVLRANETHHDVKNLISSLSMGLAELRDDAGLPPWATDLVQSLGHVAQLIEQEVAACLNDEQEDLEEVPLHDLVTRVVEFVRTDARRTQVSLVTDLEPSTVRGRPRALNRLVHNLLGNALKYAPAHSVIEVTLQAESELSVLTIRDHGPGIPPAELETIFVSGVQASTHREGLGLGLGICRRIVQDCDGQITARNAPDGGALFEVTLRSVPTPTASTGTDALPPLG